MRFAMIGAGFWSHYQLAAWQEIEGVTCVAVCDRDPARGKALAAARGIEKVHTDPEELFTSERIDFVDIVTPPATHRALVELAASRKVPIICQKPMAPELADCAAMVNLCRAAQIPFFIHENWRFQTPIQVLKETLASAPIGEIFRARIDMISGFPVFENQPGLAREKRGILADLGVHTLDTARFLFGEATRLYCQTHRVHADIQGEDAATVVLQMESGATVTVNMAYAGNPLGEDECFPQTLFFVEGSRGAIRLDRDYWLRVTTDTGTVSRRVPPPVYPWVDPAYAVAQSSAVACCRDLLGGLRREPGRGQTTGADNLKTLKLVFGAYDSAEFERAIVP